MRNESNGKRRRNPMENRRTERYDLNLPATVSLIRQDGAGAPVVLVTRDVSSSGAYFPCEHPMKPGTPVRVVMNIARSSGAGRKTAGARVTITGSVIRTECSGMAIRFNSGFRMASM